MYIHCILCEDLMCIHFLFCYQPMFSISDETVLDFEFGSVSVFFCPKTSVSVLKSVSVSLRNRYEFGIGMKSV